VEITKLRITLLPLSQTELRLIVQIMNLQTDKDSDSAPMMTVENRGRAYSQKALHGTSVKTKIWRESYVFEEKDSDEEKRWKLQKEWGQARDYLKDAILNHRHKKGMWIEGLPPIALPVDKPPVAIRYPIDLAVWLLARAVANRQRRYFVKCALCGKFGLRQRGTAKYCSEDCRLQANLEATYKRQGSDFSEYLLKQSSARRLPARHELMRRIADRKRETNR
jgi:hypothetical protein